MPTLYVVATPIGNLEDVTLRALRVLREVSLIAAEDTRTTRKLLAHHDIRARLLSYNEHNKAARIPRLLSALREGDVALVSEGGTPAVSDPGLDLVAAAVEAGFTVTPVPGASALTAALAVSGLPARQFIYLGFLPRRGGERRRLLASLRHDPRTVVAFESPHRLRRSLEDLRTEWGDRRLAVCRELTKAFEEVFRGRVGEALERFAEPRGEFTLVIEGAPAQSASLGDVEGRAEDVALPLEDARRELRRRRAAGEPAKRAVAEVAKRYGLPRREVYRLWLEAPPRSTPPEQ
jgi:16S rRNA (cytidine1402-2'-O)-methyltransferase